MYFRHDGQHRLANFVMANARKADEEFPGEKMLSAEAALCAMTKTAMSCRLLRSNSTKRKEAANPGSQGHKIEALERWIESIRRDEDSDSTDDDYRPPPERRRVRKEKEEGDLMGWESETLFPKDNSAADYIDVDDILS